MGNPASHFSVKENLKENHSLILEEQTITRVFPAQVTPLFMDQLVDVCNHLKQCMAKSGDKPSILCTLVRDLAFFSIDFFSGDRGSDLGRVKASDSLASPENNGYAFNQVFGKTLGGNGSNVFAIKKKSKAALLALLKI